VARDAYLLNLGLTPYREAWELQSDLAAAVSEGTAPDTVVLVEHPPVITLGRRTDERELHVPEDAGVEIIETDRGGKSTYHAPGQLVCYPILDLKRHGQDVRRYVRDLELSIVSALASFGLEAGCIEGLTGVWVQSPPRKIASIGVHVSRWVTTHGYALNVDLELEPFTGWITACGLDDASFTSMARELDRPIHVDDVREPAADALAQVFDLEFETLPAHDGAAVGQQPLHAKLTTRS
jgi:lipoyl(octanoyl) transferase